MKKEVVVASIVVIALMISMLTGCTNYRLDVNSDDSRINEHDAALVEQWFTEQVAEEILTLNANKDVFAILSGDKNPCAEQYIGVKLSLIRKTNDHYTIEKEVEGDYITPVGFTVSGCQYGDMAVLFGTVGDSIYDFKNDQRQPVNITEVKIHLDNGDIVSNTLSKLGAFVIFFPADAIAIELEFVGDSEAFKYSDFYDIASLGF